MDTHSEKKGKSGIGKTSQGIIFRCMRCTYNRAILMGKARQDKYPFKSFNVAGTKKRNEYLSEDDLRKLRDWDGGTDSQKKARDYFMLSFCLCGANLIDIYNLSKGTDGYITFVRKKTESRMDMNIRMKIQPEAMRLMERMKGKTGLLDCADNYSDYYSFYYATIHRLREISKIIGIPHLTTYHARKTWAQYAHYLNVPVSVIDRSLGHSGKTLGEKHYFQYDWRKTDKANRIVLDFVASNRTFDEDVDW